MSGNSIGKVLVLTTFGESHGIAVGGVLDGFPANISIDVAYIQSEVDRRRPGGKFFSSARSEEDKVEILSGLFEGRSTGAPIGFIIRNSGQRPEEYNHLKEAYRPSHADPHVIKVFPDRITRLKLIQQRKSAKGYLHAFPAFIL